MMTALEQEKFNQVVNLFAEKDKAISQFQMQKYELVRLLHELKFPSHETQPKPKLVRIK